MLYHAQCFDGFASAAVFTRFYTEYIDANAEFTYRGLRHGQGRGVDGELLDHPVNAVVDFRYSPSPKLHWWFDHHLSAFVNADDRHTYETRALDTHYWDPDEPSCAGFMARQLREKYGVRLEKLDSLVAWADSIDSAEFSDAAAAVELEAPVLQLMTVCEHLQDSYLAYRVVDAMSTGMVESIAADSEVQRRFTSLIDEQLRGQEAVETRLQVCKDVAFVDLLDVGPVTVNKFLIYYLVPDCTYAVTMMRGSGNTIKLAVGSNPWRQYARRHNIASICERYGGGGHAVVGGLSLPGATRFDGQEMLNTLVSTLSSVPGDE